MGDRAKGRHDIPLAALPMVEKETYMPIIVCTLLLLVLLIASLLLLRTGLLIITVDGQSMSPTLQPGDRVLVLRHWIAGHPRKGQIVVVTFANQSETRNSSASLRETLYIKRVVASAGE